MRKIVIMLACLLGLSRSLAYAQAAQPQDYREKTQSLSQQIHGTLDELRAQQKLSETQLVIVESALKSSEERVKELEKQVKDLTISSQNMNERLSEYSTNSTLLKNSRNKWRVAAKEGSKMISKVFDPEENKRRLNAVLAELV